MGSLQRNVYWILSLIFVFTAFLFFVDLFTADLFPCTSLNKDGNYNTSHQAEENNSHSTAKENDSYRNDVKSECAERGLVAYGQTVFMCGLLIGSLVGGILSDRYGKRVLLIGSCTVQAVTGLMSAFVPHVIFHLIARLIVGITCCGINISSFSLGVEWSVPKYRMWPPALLTFASAIGMMLFAGIASLASDWLQFSLAISVPQIVCLPIYFYIPESPRWLMTNKRFSKLDEYRKRSKEDSESLDLILNTIGCEPQNSIKLRYEDQTNSVLQYFKSGTIILRLCIMSCISLASALTYCGISYNVGSFGVNMYLGQFFSGLAECPLILMPFLLSRFGRRPLSIVSLLLSGTACLLSLLISEFCAIPALVMTLALIGKLCVQVSFCVSLLYSIELFPTVMRQKCVGFVFLWYRIGSILNALMSPGSGLSLATMICYCSGPIIGGLFCLFLPETSNMPLPDTLEDCQKQPVLPFFYKRVSTNLNNEKKSHPELSEQQ
ncbi:si:dkey-190l8.2 [Acipenser ruthenus]|uniref:si:dkey-190l8.2 n=1 Tax=Acipenser ruthenus TaxID=7906 RepID=UPI002741BFEA|nr:si:dkey-190l8.2 [Acipenser ruthenus]